MRYKRQPLGVPVGKLGDQGYEGVFIHGEKPFIFLAPIQKDKHGYWRCLDLTANGVVNFHSTTYIMPVDAVLVIGS